MGEPWVQGALSVSKAAEGALTPLGGKQGTPLSKSCHVEGPWGPRFPGHWLAGVGGNASTIKVG